MFSMNANMHFLPSQTCSSTSREKAKAYQLIYLLLLLLIPSGLINKLSINQQSSSSIPSVLKIKLTLVNSPSDGEFQSSREEGPFLIKAIIPFSIKTSAWLNKILYSYSSFKKVAYSAGVIPSISIACEIALPVEE
jgi:hypothetical protein